MSLTVWPLHCIGQSDNSQSVVHSKEKLLIKEDDPVLFSMFLSDIILTIFYLLRKYEFIGF